MLWSEDPRPRGSAAVGPLLGLTPIPAPHRHGCVTSRPLSVTSHSHRHWGKVSWKRGSLASGFTDPIVFSPFADGKQGRVWGRAVRWRHPNVQGEKLWSPELQEKTQTTCCQSPAEKTKGLKM